MSLYSIDQSLTGNADDEINGITTNYYDPTSSIQTQFNTIQSEINNIVVGSNVPVITVGSTTTLNAGQNATVILDPTSTLMNPIFDFGIPKGKSYIDDGGVLFTQNNLNTLNNAASKTYVNTAVSAAASAAALATSAVGAALTAYEISNDAALTLIGTEITVLQGQNVNQSAAVGSTTFTGSVNALGGDLTCTKIGDNGGTLRCSSIQCAHTVNGTNFSFTIARDEHGAKQNGTITDGGLQVNGGDIICDAVIAAGQDILVNNRSVNTYLDSVDNINSKVQYITANNNYTTISNNLNVGNRVGTNLFYPFAVSSGGDTSVNTLVSQSNIIQDSGSASFKATSATSLTTQNINTPASRYINIGTDSSITTPNSITIGSSLGSTVYLNGLIITTGGFNLSSFINQL